MLLPLVALLLPPAQAEPSPADAIDGASDPVTEWLLQQAARGAKNKGKGKATRKNKPHWETDYFLQPQGGVNIHSQNGESSTVATVGGQAGIEYAYVNAGTPQWRGRTRLGAAFQATDGGAGNDLRLGSFMGPHWKTWGLESGVDVFRNQWTYGATELPVSFGAEVPVVARLHVKQLSGHAGVSSSWLQDETRRVDWSQQKVPGFGHEFAYLAGIGGTIAGVGLGANAEYRVTAGGPVSTFTLNASVDGATFNDIFGGVLGGGGAEEPSSPGKK